MRRDSRKEHANAEDATNMMKVKEPVEAMKKLTKESGKQNAS